MKVVIKILLLLPLIYMIGIPFYFAQKVKTIPCGGISIDIVDSSDYHFVTKGYLKSLVAGTGQRYLGVPLDELAVNEIEGKLSAVKQLREAEVFYTIDGFIHVYVNQRDPVMRVIASGGDYFVDNEGVVFPKRGLYTPRLHVVEGNVRVTKKMLDGVSVLDTCFRKSSLRDAWYLVNYLRGDRFWSAQVDQIFVDDDDEIDLVPRMGKNIIHLGTIENMEGKLRNLEAFYKQVLPETGWGRYSLINLEYKDQIVCKKRPE